MALAVSRSISNCGEMLAGARALDESQAVRIGPHDDGHDDDGGDDECIIQRTIHTVSAKL
eukprot:6689972-Pyramimonas_sp.AAC.1